MSSTLAVLQQFSTASRIFPKQFIFSHFHIVVRIKPKLHSNLSASIQPGPCLTLSHYLLPSHPQHAPATVDVCLLKVQGYVCYQCFHTGFSSAWNTLSSAGLFLSFRPQLKCHLSVKHSLVH